MWIKSNQHFSQLLLLFSSGWHSRIQPGHHEIWKGLLFTRDYQYEWAGTAKMFHSCLENKLRLSVPAQHLEKILPSKRVWGSSRCGASSFYRSASARWWGRARISSCISSWVCVFVMPSQKKHCVSAAVVVLRVYAMTSHCNRPTTIIPVVSTIFGGLKFLAFHQAWPASLGPQTISRMPKAWVEAPLLPVESTCNSEVSRTQQTDSWNYWKISQTSSKTPHYSTINDHQSKLISSTYDTTSDMMQNHWFLWYCCASTNSSWTSKIFLQNLSFACSFSLTFQVSAHLQCLIQCLHCPSKELCVDVLAWMNLWMNQELTSADGFPKWWHSIIGWCRKDASRESLLTPPRELE